MESLAASPEPTKYASKPRIPGRIAGPEAFDLRVLIKRRPSVYSHHTLQCSTDNTGTKIFDALRQLHRDQDGVKRHYFKCVARLFLMQRISIGTARIFETQSLDLEDQRCPQVLHISDNSHDYFLTTAFRNPATVSDVTTLSHLLRQHDALTISFTFDRTIAWLWTFTAVLFSLVAGIAYSVVAKDFNTGLAIGTATLAVLLAFQGLLVFFSR